MTTFARTQLAQLHITRQERPFYLLVGAWVLAMIAFPIARWVFGDAAIVPGTIVTTLFQFSASAFIVAMRWGWRRTLLTLLIATSITWAFEAVGTATGFPFGDYTYTDRLQPQVAHVPLLIPLAWFMMLPASWLMASLIYPPREGLRHRVVFALVSALAITAWDLFLDPQMVEWGFWVWNNPPEPNYFGIPYLNFFGWVLTAFTITLIINPARLPILPLVTIYCITWIFQTIGQAVFWGLAGSALFGFLGMGAVVLLAAWRWTTRQKAQRR